MKLSTLAQESNLTAIFNNVTCGPISAPTGSCQPTDLAVEKVQLLLMRQLTVTIAASRFSRANDKLDCELYRSIRHDLFKLVKREVALIGPDFEPEAKVISKEIQLTDGPGKSAISNLLDVLTAYQRVTTTEAVKLLPEALQSLNISVEKCEKFIQKTKVFVHPTQTDLFFLNARKSQKPTASSETVHH